MTLLLHQFLFYSVSCQCKSTLINYSQGFFWNGGSFSNLFLKIFSQLCYFLCYKREAKKQQPMHIQTHPVHVHWLQLLTCSYFTNHILPPLSLCGSVNMKMLIYDLVRNLRVMHSFKIYDIWLQGQIHTHMCNAVPLVWGLLGLTPIITDGLRKTITSLMT